MFRGIGAVTAAAVISTLLTAFSAPPHAAAGWQPPIPADHILKAKPRAFTPLSAPVDHGVRQSEAITWPRAGEADVALTAAADQAGTAPRHSTATVAAAPQVVGSVPIALHPAPGGLVPRSAPAADTVHVKVLDQAAAKAARVSGVLLSVTSAGRTPGPLAGEFDYSSFRNAGGAGFGARLHLVSLPACALTTPQVPACQVQTAVPGSVNDAARHVVSGPLASAPAAAGKAPVAAASGTSTTVYALTSGSSGSTGDFTASGMNPSGSWSAGSPSGGFSWSYPVPAPPSAAGSAPHVELGYSSSAIDGRTGMTNNQPSWIGEGWDYSPGFVERTYRSCSEFTDLPSASQTGDQCWAGQILTLSLGQGTETVVYDDADHTFHQQSDDGNRIELLTGADNGALNGEYWKVTTTDGTQYFFGRNSGPGHSNQQTTNSTWTEPVYGAHSGDPCHSASGFSASACTQAWRWNLDYVEDTHGNATVYYYTPETNFYGQNNGTAGVSYVRGGYLNRIDYGLRDENGTVYGGTVPDQIVFNVAERCVPGSPTDTITCDPAQRTSANFAAWPDTPVDQQCNSGDTCNTHSPTFWSTKRLTNITTQVTNGAGGYTKVDSIDLGQTFPADGDSELWLSSITRTGYRTVNGATTSLPLPPVTFGGQPLANRVPGYNGLPGMNHRRLSTITTETGGIIAVTYSSSCTAATIPSDPSQNTSMCMPTYWGAPGQTKPYFDYFMKYRVDEVDQQGNTVQTPIIRTGYKYPSAPLWHYDDNELVKPENRTYGQFRGYNEVDTYTGSSANGETLTKAVSFYYTGMDGDTLPNNGKRTKAYTNSLGESLPDDARFLGQAYETVQYNGDGGARLSRTFTTPSVIATTATRARTGLPALTADMVRTVRSRTLTDLAAGGTRGTSAAVAYDATGRTTTVDARGDGVPETCTINAYADNTTSWIRHLTSEVVTSGQACPPAGTAPSNVLSDTRTYYDGSGELGQIPGAGDPTRTDTLDDLNGGAPAFITMKTLTYDASGRVLTTADALNRATRTAYTPADGGPLTQVAVTNPLNQTSTLTLNPDRGTKATSTDLAGHTSTAVYDPLGRLTQFNRPGHGQQNYSYLLRTDGPEAVTTNTVIDYGTGIGTVTSVALSDALGRPVQTQTQAEGGNVVASNVTYDGHGWQAATDNRFLFAGLPSTTVQDVNESDVDDRTVATFDGAGRVVTSAEYSGDQLKKSTRTVYGGDRVTVVPPDGGTTVTTIADALGRVVELDQYTSPPAITGSVVSGGAFQATSYGYDTAGRRISLKSSGSTWTDSYDMLGMKLSRNDPDNGTSQFTYDNAGQIAVSTDARGQKLAYTYDALGRPTAEYSGSTAGTKLASWVYDTIQVGQPTSETRYTPNGNYVQAVSGYDPAGRPANQSTTLPASETGLARTYTTRFGYTTTGLPLTMQPASVTGMPGETITTTYDALGMPVAVKGTSIMAGQVLSAYGLPAQVTYGSSTNTAKYSITYDQATLKPKETVLTAQLAVPQLDDTTYQRDPAGRITRITDVQGPKGSSPVDDQCFGYDALSRMTQAWSATDGCAGAPDNTSSGLNIGGPNAYWTSWSFDAAGDRISQTRHQVTGSGADTTTTYAYNTAAGGHSLASTSTTGPDGASSTSYGYDPAGETIARKGVAGGDQVLDWTEEGALKSVALPSGSVSYVYGAAGDQIVRHDPGSTTVYLPGQEITRTSAGTITATRYYSLGGLTVGMISSAGNQARYLIGDQNGSQTMAVDVTTLALTRRSFDPFGNQRGAVQGGAWVDNHGFLDKPADTNSGLTDVGARKYDPVTGRFINVDPVFDAGDPQSLTGYAYANQQPVTAADPSGRFCDGCSMDNPDSVWNPQNHAPSGDHFCDGCSVDNPDSVWNPSNTGFGGPGCTTEGCYTRQGHLKDKNGNAIDGHGNPIGLPPLKTVKLFQPNYPSVSQMAGWGDYHPDLSYELNVELYFRSRCSEDMTQDGCLEISQHYHTWAAVNDIDENPCAAGTLCDAMQFLDIPEGGPLAADADAAAAAAARGERGGGCPHSFAGDTPVLMADGTTEAIEDVKAGDEIANAQPGGEGEHHRVDEVHVTGTDTDFTDLTIDTPSGPRTVTGTQNHPYFDVSTGTFVPASDLKAGERLQSTDGTVVTVRAVRNYTSHMTTYDLTVDGVHTYYVVAGTTPVLVHNCGGWLDGHEHNCVCDGTGGDPVYPDAPSLDEQWEDATSSTSTRDVHGALRNAERESGDEIWNNPDSHMYNQSDGQTVKVLNTGNGMYSVAIRDMSNSSGGYTSVIKGFTQKELDGRLREGTWG
ncbi:polymorphic toxin-type HINT domain-containing protein [Catenulispora subtropica]|uniref:RHS repeat-associated core domain-containing protein n=1 Tax=Catenulispora subtropica TaxID=450798 RepID=A0ABP5EIH5_9ACTN